MKVLITGASGTIGKALIDFFKKIEINFEVWNKEIVSIEDYWKMENYIKKVNPDIIYHLAVASEKTGIEDEVWKVNVDWPGELAWISRILNKKFVFLSTVQVFSDSNNGPFTISSNPDNTIEIGYEKRMAEERILHQNPDSIIIRLGWQIGEKKYKNNIINFLDIQFEQKGKILASSKWFPACSFIEDTVSEIFRVSIENPNGIFLFDSNDNFNYYEIVKLLKRMYQKSWIVEETFNFEYDQRMIDNRVNLPKLSEKLNPYFFIEK